MAGEGHLEAAFDELELAPTVLPYLLSTGRVATATAGVLSIKMETAHIASSGNMVGATAPWDGPATYYVLTVVGAMGERLKELVGGAVESLTSGVKDADQVSQHHGSVQAEADNEQFDTFDAAYTPLGPKQRGEVHAKDAFDWTDNMLACTKQGIWHQAVHVLVFNSAGQLLLQQRSQGKRVCPGSWDLSCAEHLSQGESFHQAAVRGLAEELGITPDRYTCCPARTPPDCDTSMAQTQTHTHTASYQAADNTTVMLAEHTTAAVAAIDAATDAAGCQGAGTYCSPAACETGGGEAGGTGEGMAEVGGAGCGNEMANGSGGARLWGPVAPTRTSQLEYTDIGIRDYEFVQTWQLDGYDGPLCFNAHEVSAVRWSGVEEGCLLSQLTTVLSQLRQGCVSSSSVSRTPSRPGSLQSCSALRPAPATARPSRSLSTYSAKRCAVMQCCWRAAGCLNVWHLRLTSWRGLKWRAVRIPSTAPATDNAEQPEAALDRFMRLKRRGHERNPSLLKSQGRARLPREATGAQASQAEQDDRHWVDMQAAYTRGITIEALSASWPGSQSSSEARRTSYNHTSTSSHVSSGLHSHMKGQHSNRLHVSPAEQPRTRSRSRNARPLGHTSSHRLKTKQTCSEAADAWMDMHGPSNSAVSEPLGHIGRRRRRRSRTFDWEAFDKEWQDEDEDVEAEVHFNFTASPDLRRQHQANSTRQQRGGCDPAAPDEVPQYDQAAFWTRAYYGPSARAEGSSSSSSSTAGSGSTWQQPEDAARQRRSNSSNPSHASSSSSASHASSQAAVRHPPAVVSHLAALGLAADTQLSLAAVRAAFHRCALRFHPDRFSVTVDQSERTVAEQRFKAANIAWEALKPICQ
ncbi:hypothetical protein QJQ45_019447 [Haematococcus lacustris]|nr:hypothetical protein QJQ45_019447 [Haematococcus lacustris]